MKIPEPVKRIARQLLPPGLHPRRIRGGALRGRRVYVDLRVDTQAWRGVYERPLQDWLTRHVAPGAVCVDVGAADGYFTLLCAIRAGPSGRVIAFEPSDRGKQLRRNLDLNADVPLAPVHEIRAYAARSDAPAVAADGTPQVTIDTALAGLGVGRCDVVKIDVDGGEVDVLDGMSAALTRYCPHLAIEVHSVDLRDGVLSILQRFGYLMMEVAPPPHEYRPLAFNPTLFSIHRPGVTAL
jgi:FkbM family methyltransferase